MSALAVKEQGSPMAADPEVPHLTTLSIDELIIGRQSASPIYDVNGVLLLAENQVITSEIKTRLKKRANGGNIQINNDALSKMTLGNIEASGVPRFQIDEALCRKIDMILDNGLMTVKNTGPAFSQQVISRGCESYDEEQTERLREQNVVNTKLLGSLLTDATHGRLTDCDAVAGMAAQYLREMASDTDNVLTSAIGDRVPGDIAANSLESALLAMAIGIEMDFDADNLKNLGIAGLTHDWGMVRVPEDLRNAARKLTRLERLEIEKHPIHSMESNSFNGNVAEDCSGAKNCTPDRVSGT